MKNEKGILLINVIDLAVLASIFIFFISGASSLNYFDLIIHLVFLCLIILFSFVILYCSLREKTIPYKNKRINAKQMTITLGVLIIIVLVNNLIFYTEGSRYNIQIRNVFNLDIIAILILYLVLGGFSIISGLLFKKKPPEK